MTNVLPLPAKPRNKNANNRFKFTRENLRRTTTKIDAEGGINVTLWDTQEIGLVLRKQRAHWMVALVKFMGGKTYRRTIGPYDRDTFDIHNARVEAARIRAAIADGTMTSQREAHKVAAKVRAIHACTIAEAIDLHQEANSKTRATTVDTYRRQLGAAFGADTRMNDMTEAKVQNWYTSALDSGRAVSGLNSTWSAGRAIWNTWAEQFPDDERPTANPFVKFAGKRAKRLKASTSRTSSIPLNKTAEFIAAAMEGMRAGGKDAEACAAVAFLALTGARASGVRKLRRDHVLGRALHIPADDMKAGREHIRPMTPLLREVLDHQLAKNAGDIVFVGDTRDGAVGDLRGSIERICERIGTPRITAHDLRRTYAAAATKALLPDVIVSLLLGHTLKNVTDKYAAALMPELPQYAEKVERQLMLPGEDAASGDQWWER